MSYVSKVVYVQGFYGKDIEGQAVDDNGNVLDLTEFTTIKFRMRKTGESTKVDAAVTVVDAVNGKWKYTVASGDFDAVGTYECQLVCQKTGAEVTVSGLTIIIKEQVPAKS